MLLKTKSKRKFIAIQEGSIEGAFDELLRFGRFEYGCYATYLVTVDT